MSCYAFEVDQSLTKCLPIYAIAHFAFSHVLCDAAAAGRVPFSSYSEKFCLQVQKKFAGLPSLKKKYFCLRKKDNL